VNDRKRFDIQQWDSHVLNGQIAACTEELCAGKGGAHFETREAGGSCCVFAGNEKQRADSAACPVGMNEKGADFGGIAVRVEQVVVAVGPLIRAV